MSAFAFNINKTSGDDKSRECLVLEVESMKILLPRLLVAEIIQRNSVTVSSSIKKEIKIIEWRGVQVPLIGSNIINAASTTELVEYDKIVVIHGLLNSAKLPYYAFPVSRAPKLLTVNDTNIFEDNESYDSQLPTESLRVQIEGGQYIIPKIEHFEKYTIDNCFK